MKKKALMRHFASIDDIIRADLDTLEQVPELSAKDAQAVYDYFREEEPKKKEEVPEDGAE